VVLHRDREREKPVGAMVSAWNLSLKQSDRCQIVYRTIRIDMLERNRVPEA
jgi:hypothetical protein